MSKSAAFRASYRQNIYRTNCLIVGSPSASLRPQYVVKPGIRRGRKQMLSGGCQCGAIRYEISGDPINHSLCHCVDCRRSAGAPVVGWAMMQQEQLRVTGETAIYASSEHARRHFCIQCGTGLFYTNSENLPGLVDVQTGTLDDPNELPAQSHIQVAERISWMADAHKLPEYERYPSEG